MLRQWLYPLSVDEFLATFLRKQAWARPGAAREQAQLCTWKSVGRLLDCDPRPDVLVVASGRLLEVAPPRNLMSLRRVMKHGAGLCVRHAERNDPELTVLSRSLGAVLSGKAVHAQIFVTPGGTHGFGWHYDAEDVFILQTEGVKDYYFRKNTVDAGGATPAFDFARIRAETSGIQTARLVAGDCLYIPARWWHMARCLEDSLSISLGAPED